MIAQSRIERGATPRQPAHGTGNVGNHRHVSIRDMKHFTERIHTGPFCKSDSDGSGPCQLLRGESRQKCSDDPEQLTQRGNRLNVLAHSNIV